MQLPQCVRGGHHAAGCGTATCTHSYERRGARVHVYMHVHKYLLCIMCTVCIFILITMSAQTSYHAARSSALRVYLFDHARPRAHACTYLSCVRISQTAWPVATDHSASMYRCDPLTTLTHTHMHMRPHTYTHLQTHMHTCTCTYTYAHTHTHTHPYT